MNFDDVCVFAWADAPWIPEAAALLVVRARTASLGGRALIRWCAGADCDHYCCAPVDHNHNNRSACPVVLQHYAKCIIRHFVVLTIQINFSTHSCRHVRHYYQLFFLRKDSNRTGGEEASGKIHIFLFYLLFTMYPIWTFRNQKNQDIWGEKWPLSQLNCFIQYIGQYNYVRRSVECFLFNLWWSVSWSLDG